MLYIVNYLSYAWEITLDMQPQCQLFKDLNKAGKGQGAQHPRSPLPEAGHARYPTTDPLCGDFFPFSSLSII